MRTETAVIAWSLSHTQISSREDGQLGLGNDEDREWVCEVKALKSYSVSSVVAGSRNFLAICDDGMAANGGWHCLAVDDQGHACAWGGNEYGQCGVEPERKDDTGGPLRRDIVIPQRCAPKLSVRQVAYHVAAGGTQSVVLTCEGHVWTRGQLWPPADIKQIFVPVRVQGLERVWLIAVGAFHNLALEGDGTLWAWGNNEYGQLGTADTQPRSQPICVEQLSGLTVVDIAACGWHSTALTDGEVYGWGRGERGSLGFGDDKSSKMHPQKYRRGDHGRLGCGRKNNSRPASSKCWQQRENGRALAS
ncbi:hypothetical protein Cgig2_011933 [Carnegiea gigantea]|uniref:Uncharacterized protein n=1 Tax=Carnegiea gigantea TaxID=171969 RepID=A0A9Q1JP12_9CARY|nr:hypothetical protein Cgig2_011933 [Carnegiea gigantea]